MYDIPSLNRYIAMLIPVLIIFLLLQNKRISNLNMNMDVLEGNMDVVQREYVVLHNTFLNLTSYYNRSLNNN